MAQDMVKHKIAKKKREIKQKEYIVSKKNVLCADCGNKFPSYVMDFHHLNEDIKDDHLKGSSMSNKMKGWSTKRIDEELDKCVVLCANCHRIRHYKER